MTRLKLLAVLALALSFLAISTTPASASTTSYTKVVRYGPFTIPGGTDAEPCMIHNQLRLGVARPCGDCYITSFTPDVVYSDGSQATMKTGAMLHHAVFASQLRLDATCTGTWLGLAGERFFASGNERTAIKFPSGYGYRLRSYDSWNLLVDLMNHTSSSQTVYLKVTYTYRPSRPACHHQMGPNSAAPQRVQTVHTLSLMSGESCSATSIPSNLPSLFLVQSLD